MAFFSAPPRDKMEKAVVKHLADVTTVTEQRSLEPGEAPGSRNTW